MTLLVLPDAERIVSTSLAELIASGRLPTPPAGTSWRRGTTIPNGVTPAYFLQARGIGGPAEQRVAFRPRVDVRVWADGSSATLAALNDAALLVLAWLQDDLRARAVMTPARMPDPADPTRTHSMLTVELLAKGQTA